MNKQIFFLIFILLPSLIFSKKVINSGHQYPVKFIEYSQDEDLFFSVSEDGTLVIKKSDEEKISKRLFLTSNTITQIALSPKNNHLAIVETDSSSHFYVSVWDWKNERKLYSINMKEFPMSIGFSGNGSYIYITSISSQPVKIFNSTTGASTTFLNGNINFIDFIYIGSSEKTAFLYSSSGLLDIRELNNSNLLKSIRTEKNLLNMSITPDKRFLVGQKDSTIYIIGRNDGIVYSKKVIPELKHFIMNNSTGEILCFIDNKYRKTISTYSIIGGEFFDTQSNEIVVKNDIEVFAASDQNIILSDSKGHLQKYNSWNNTYTTFLENKLINIEDISIVDDMALILTNEQLFIFKSPFFSDSIKNSKRLATYTLEKMPSPLINPIGSKIVNNNLLLWNDSIVYLNLTTNEIIFKENFTSEIIDVKVENEKMLILDKNGMVKIINLETGEIIFSFKSLGFTSVAFYKENEILGGTDKSNGGSLMILDTKTRETIPLKNNLDVVFAIIPSNTQYKLYLSGLKKINGINQSYFTELNLLNKSERILLNNNTEILESSYTIDESNMIFTNLGTKSILSIDSSNKRIKPFEQTTNQTKIIKYNNGGIYTINENSSLSIWNPSSGKKIIDFYLFNDDEWVAVSDNSINAFGSEKSEQYISTN